MGVTSMFCPGQNRNGRLSWMGFCLGTWMGVCPGTWMGFCPGTWMGFCPGTWMGFCPGTWMGFCHFSRFLTGIPFHGKTPSMCPIHDRRPFLLCPGQNIEVTPMPHLLHTNFLVSPHPLSLLPQHLPGQKWRMRSSMRILACIFTLNIGPQVGILLYRNSLSIRLKLIVE